MPEQNDKKTKVISLNRILPSLYDWVGTLAIALTAFSLLFVFVVRIVGVDGSSMNPTYRDGDLLLLSLLNDRYERGDVVVVDRYTEDPLIKRIIAVGGDTLSIDPEGNVFLNGRLLKEKYIQGKTVLRDFSGEIRVPKGYLFIMGDNRSVSKDSRSEEIGLVSVKDVIGEAVYCVWPPKSIGSVR